MKTAEEYFEEKFGNKMNTHSAYSWVVEFAKEYAAQFKPQWISVEERLPDAYNKKYLVKFITVTGDEEQCVSQFCSVPRHCFENPTYDDVWYVYPSEGHTLKPTHWMPLPEKPKM